MTIRASMHARAEYPCPAQQQIHADTRLTARKRGFDHAASIHAKTRMNSFAQTQVRAFTTRIMTPSRSFASRRLLSGPLAIQGVLAATAMIFVTSPAHGGAAVFLPLDGSGSAKAIAWSQANGAKLIAPGPYDGSFIVRAPQTGGPLAAMRARALLISVPEFLCGTPTANRTANENG